MNGDTKKDVGVTVGLSGEYERIVITGLEMATRALEDLCDNVQHAAITKAKSEGDLNETVGAGMAIAEIYGEFNLIKQQLLAFAGRINYRFTGNDADDPETVFGLSDLKLVSDALHEYNTIMKERMANEATDGG